MSWQAGPPAHLHLPNRVSRTFNRPFVTAFRRGKFENLHTGREAVVFSEFNRVQNRLVTSLPQLKLGADRHQVVVFADCEIVVFAPRCAYIAGVYALLYAF